MNQTCNSFAYAIFTDLDGTLLDKNQRLSLANRETLEQLGRDKIWRIVVTGRSLFSARRVLDPKFPIDVLVTASGAGIFSFPDEQMLRGSIMEESQVQLSAKLLKQFNLDFMVHAPLPDNHLFKWYRCREQNADFSTRLAIYSGYHQPLPVDLTRIGAATQLLAVCPHDHGQLHQRLQTELWDLNVIRTTSPLDHHSIWYEIFPRGISKSSAAAWVCEHYGIDQTTTLAIGNAYNDLDLLQWSSFSSVVANAPADIRCQFKVVATHNNNGFTEAVTDWRKIVFSQYLSDSP